MPGEKEVSQQFLVFGPSEAGKTSLINYLVSGQYQAHRHKKTEAESFQSAIINNKEVTVRLRLYDFPTGHAKHSSRVFHPNISGVIFVFAADDPQITISMDNELKQFFPSNREEPSFLRGRNLQFYIVINKMELASDSLKDFLRVWLEGNYSSVSSIEFISLETKSGIDDFKKQLIENTAKHVKKHPSQASVADTLSANGLFPPASESEPLLPLKSDDNKRRCCVCSII